MSDHAQLARTGTAGGVVVIGGTALAGWELLLFALAIVALGVVAVRVGFRHGRKAHQK